MNISQRKSTLIKQINNISDEQTLEMLEQTIGFFTHDNGKDITDTLDKRQMQELFSLAAEPAEKDTISEEEFNKLFARWGTK